MKNEVPGGDAKTQDNSTPADEQLVERLQNDTAVDLEKPENKVADPIPDKINGVDAPWTSAKKRSKKPLLAAIIAIIVLLLAAVVAWYFLVQLPNQSKNSDGNDLAAATRFASAQALVDEVKPSLKGATMNVAEVTGVSAADNDGNYAYGVPAYKSEGADFKSQPLQMSGSAYTGNSAAAASNYNALVDFFKKNKFVKKLFSNNIPGTTSDSDSEVNYVSYAEYESSNLLCAIRHADASSTSLKAHIASVGCADKESYKQASDGLKPIHAAYLKGESDASDDLVFGFLGEGEGADGYKYAKIYQEDENIVFDDVEEAPASLVGLYYKAPGASEWTYFTINSVDAYPYCASYGTDTLKKAFKGYECFDEAANKESVVR